VDLKYDEIVDFSGVEKFINTPVKRYSSGMRVRLAFSVAAHLEPEILIIDEVLSVGDADFQNKCINKMEDVSQQGRTVLFVSHNMSAVTRLCERTILLQEGKIADDGPSHKVVSSYLTSSLGTTAAREWADPSKAPGGDVCRLRAVRVCDKDNRISDTIDIREKLKIEMEYEVMSPGHVMLPQFSVSNELGRIAFVTVDQDPEWRQCSRPEGNYVSTVWIPGNLLAEGMMFIGCYLITLNPDKPQFAERSVVAFNVVDTLEGNSARGDYARRIPGVVRPLLKWTTKFSPNGSGSQTSSD
jgi:lipopolysaccharide transport system ATP-binding protein